MSKTIALIGIALVALAAAALPVALNAQEQGIHVLDHACDKDGAVTALQILATGPGVVVLRWDNKAVCGTGV